MAQLVVDITISLDGFVAGPDPDTEHPLGIGGDCLLAWIRNAASPPCPAAPPGSTTSLGTTATPSTAAVSGGGEWGRGVEGVGVDGEVLMEVRSGFGAYVMGRRTFEVVPVVGLEPVSGAPCFVVTGRAPDGSRRGRTAYVFVSQGIGRAFELASAAAGDQPVGILGSASVARQYLRAGLVDELRLHVVPVLLGSGIRLFEGLRDVPIRLRRTGGIDSPYASHVKFRVLEM